MTSLITPRTACRYLRDLNDPSTHFCSIDGTYLTNLFDLACYLKSCEQESFNYHVTHGHNHFSNWVRHNILDRDLADEMSLVIERNPMRLMVQKRINYLVHHATRTPYPRERAKMVLEDCMLPEEVFIANDGSTIRNLWELQGFLDSANDATVAYHITPNKNDFSEWVGDKLMDFELSDKLAEETEKDKLKQHVDKRLYQLEAFRAHKPRSNLEEYIKAIRKKK